MRAVVARSRVTPDRTLASQKALLEALLAKDDLALCAQWCLDWLADHAGIDQAVCIAQVSATDRLFAVASRGLPSSAVAEFTLDVDERENPLVAALDSPGRVIFGPEAHVLSAPLAPPFEAIPLRSREAGEERAAGLLVVKLGEGADSDALQWLSRVLGEKLARLRTSQLFAQHRFGRERTLATEAALLQTIVNTVSDPILLTDVEGRLIIANTRAERLFTARESDNEGRRRATTLNNMLFSAALAAQTVGAETARRELTLVDPAEGTDILYELLSSVVKDPQGGTGVVSILRNVTDLGRASEELKENYLKLRIAQNEVQVERRRLDLIIDSVADPIVVSDAAGDIVLLNAPAEKLFTVTLELSAPAKARVRSNDAHFSSFVSNLLFSGAETRYRGEVTMVDPLNGNTIPVEAIAGKILSETGELTAVVTILHDRTEAVEKGRLYEQLERAKAELEEKVHAATRELAQQNELLRRQAIALEQASALKTQFLANMSHEFRTPLNAILGYTHMLLTGVQGSLAPAQRRGVERIASNGQSLLNIINEILDISRIEAGRMPLASSEFKLGPLVKEVLAELASLIEQSRLDVTHSLPADLPAVRSDRQKIKQIVLNLLNNALKFTPRGSIQVVAAHDATRGTVSLSVIDTGIGIDPKDHARVFEDFQQVDSSPARQFTGAGLGLSICRRLASVLGGTIALESRPGDGSRFTLVIPRTLKKRS